MSLNLLIVKVGRTYPISAGSMGVIFMLEPLAALELHVPVVAVPGGVARDVQGVVKVAATAVDTEVDVVVDVVDVVDVADVAVDGDRQPPPDRHGTCTHSGTATPEPHP